MTTDPKRDIFNPDFWEPHPIPGASTEEDFELWAAMGSRPEDIKNPDARAGFEAYLKAHPDKSNFLK